MAASQPAIILDDLQNASGVLGDYDSLYGYHKSDSHLFTVIAIPLTVSLGRRNCLTFVEKGKKIWWALKDTLSFTSTNMQAAMQNENTYVYENNWGRVRFQNVTAKVY